MAKNHSTVHEFGYPDERFVSVLSENLHCAICSCVLKDPVMCKNEHCFCRTCITKHLDNYQNCPSCNQELSVESLADAPRIVRNLLAEQKIHCDYHERGCEEIVELGNLASHVAVCGKAPVVCSNEECSGEINREDQLRHESEECKFREITCRSCKEMGSMVQEIVTSLDGLCEHVLKLNSRFDAIENRFEEVQNQFRCEESPQREAGRVQSDQASAQDPSSELDERYPKENAYVVAGGYGSGSKVIDSAEVFDKTSNSWRHLQPMKKGRAEACSVVYNGHILVAGGRDGSRIVSSVEQFSRFWSSFPANLPKSLSGHRSACYGDRMFVIGGYDGEERAYSDMIYEIQLRFPFTTKILVKLPVSTPFQCCGFVTTNDKILIFGGLARDKSNRATADVTMYDMTKNKFEELEPLPYSVCNMATGKYEGNVILAGGSENCNSSGSKDTVISYNIETQKSVMLPAMKKKRHQFCAIVDGHSLVVMGGQDERGCYLDSGEEFNFKTSKWTSLPSMKATRGAFVAEII